MSYLTTYTGQEVWFAEPTVDQVCIEDIAHALANLCRYHGHCREFYSVAQHSVEASRRLPAHLALEGLLHDASEAYLNDLARGLKHLPEMSYYRQLEDNLERLIAARFKLVHPLPPEIKMVDNRLALTEALALLPPTRWTSTCNLEPYEEPIHPMTPEFAKQAFLNRYEDLRRT